MSDDDKPNVKLGSKPVRFNFSARKFKKQKSKSKRQESSIAEEMSGRRSPSSGAVRKRGYSVKGTPGDVTSREAGFRVEAKYTDNKSFRITEDVVAKTISEANQAGLDWVLQVDIYGFSMRSLPERFAILDWDTFLFPSHDPPHVWK